VDASDIWHPIIECIIGLSGSLEYIQYWLHLPDAERVANGAAVPGLWHSGGGASLARNSKQLGQFVDGSGIEPCQRPDYFLCQASLQ
jgi:hypothetical protein